jgi:hypothetical protein
MVVVARGLHLEGPGDEHGHLDLRVAPALVVRSCCYRLGTQGKDLVLFNCRRCHTTIARRLVDDPWQELAAAA